MRVHRRPDGYSMIELLVAIGIVAILVGLLVPAVQRVRATMARLECQNNLKQLSLALHNYNDRCGKLPPGLSVRSDDSRFPYLGWEARILPDIEQASLWQQVEEAFEGDPDPFTFYGYVPQQRLLGKPVLLFNCPSDPRLPGPQIGVSGLLAFTSYLGVEGRDQYTKDGMLFLDSDVRLIDVTDGTSNTLMLGERPPSADLRYGWWYRGWGQSKDGSIEMLLGASEWNVVGEGCPAGPYAFGPGRFDNQCDAFHFWSPHTGGANFAFGDGSVRFLLYSAEPVMPALATRSGGEAVTIPD